MNSSEWIQIHYNNWLPEDGKSPIDKWTAAWIETGAAEVTQGGSVRLLLPATLGDIPGAETQTPDIRDQPGGDALFQFWMEKRRREDERLGRDRDRARGGGRDGSARIAIRGGWDYDSFDVCCPASCGKCGGDGCESRPGGRTACCVKDVQKTAPPCATNGWTPPCANAQSQQTIMRYGGRRRPHVVKDNSPLRNARCAYCFNGVALRVTE